MSAEQPAAQPTPREIEHTIEALVELSYALERRLEDQNAAQAHESLFAVRELLLDLRRVLLSIEQACGTLDVVSARAALASVAEMVLYEVLPHAEFHMSELAKITDTPPT